MTLPKKDSRPIEVDDRHYRWMARPSSVDPELVRITIEDQKTGEIQQARRRVNFRDGHGAVTPYDVSEIIKERFPCPPTT